MHGEALERAALHAQRWIAGLDERSVAASTCEATLRKRIDAPLPTRGVEPAVVIDDLVEATEGGHLGSASGRFFAWVIGGGLQSALGADWLVSSWDQNATLTACGPAVSILEETAGEWIKELLDLPRDASLAFTSGCQMAHFCAMAAARHALLAREGWDVEQDGLFSAPRIRVISSRLRHDSVDRAVRFLGLGEHSIVQAATNDLGQITREGLLSALHEADGNAIVVLNAADLNIGAFDRFTDLIPLAHDAGAWVHIDGAFGLFARASRSKSHLADGLELADSWATDAHKWLNVPFDCGIVLVRDREAHLAAMSVDASYITAANDARDAIDFTPEWSRRARGVTVYAALRELGRSGVEALVDRSSAHCLKLVSEIGELPHAKVVAVPTLNQGLVRFEKPGLSDEKKDDFTDGVIAAINETGAAFFSGTRWQGRRAMRVSVVNWRTSLTDIERTIDAIRSVTHSVPGSIS